MDAQLTAVMVLWTVLLAVVLFALVPLVVYRFIRLVQAAWGIQTHFAHTLEAAVGIVGNTAPATPALDQTIEVAGGILATAGRIDAHSAAIEDLLTTRARAGGSQ